MADPIGVRTIDGQPVSVEAVTDEQAQAERERLTRDFREELTALQTRQNEALERISRQLAPGREPTLFYHGFRHSGRYADDTVIYLTDITDHARHGVLEFATDEAVNNPLVYVAKDGHLSRDAAGKPFPGEWTVVGTVGTEKLTRIYLFNLEAARNVRLRCDPVVDCSLILTDGPYTSLPGRGS